MNLSRRVTALLHTLRSRVSGERGDGNVEFVLLFPLFAGMVFVAIQGAIWYDAGNAAQSAANVALNEARLYEGNVSNATAVGNDYIDSHASNLLDASVTITRNDTAVTVTVTGRTNSFFDLWGDIQRTATAPVERWIE